MRVAVGAIFTESNHLVGTLTDLACFERTELRRGAEVLSAADGVLGGALRQLRERGAAIAPALFASAVPGGPLARGCYETLKAELLERLRAALPVDGVLMPQHGGAAVDGMGELDGDLIEAVRATVGDAAPVVVTLDCHANVTPRMVANADALLAWETYPHRDTFATGVRGARLLMDTLEGKLKPAMAAAKVPVIVGGFMGGTDEGPFARVMRFAKSFEGAGRVASTSAILVQPHLDLPGMGGGGIAVTDGDAALAEETARKVAEMYWNLRRELEPRLWTPRQAIDEGLGLEGGPVLLLETSDCVGGGAAGDSAAVLRALLEHAPGVPSMVPVVDPEAAAACHRHKVGDQIALEVGHRVDPRWGTPVAVRARIATLTDGRFVYSGGIWGGQTATMGPSAMLEAGETRILVASHPTYDWADEQFRSVGLDPRTAKFVVVKNPMNYRVGYAGLYQAVFVLDTPGPTPASVRAVPFQRLQRPFFPADEEIAGMQPAILRGRG
jgi:microcystin degradation protein MlrC